MKLVLLLLFTFLYLTKAFPKGALSISEKEYNLKIGVGLRVKTNIRTDNEVNLKKNDPITVPFPFMRFKFSRLEIEPDKLKWVFAKSSWFSLNTRLHYMGHNYNTPTIGHRHKSLFGGFSLRILLFKLKLLKDITNKSNGSVTEASALLPVYFTDNTKALLQAGYEYWDSKYINYYFGVKKHEETDFRPYFEGTKKRSVFGKFILISRFSPHWLTRFTFKFRRWFGDMIDSPTVNTTKIFDSVLGVVYEF